MTTAYKLVLPGLNRNETFEKVTENVAEKVPFGLSENKEPCKTMVQCRSRLDRRGSENGPRFLGQK